MAPRLLLLKIVVQDPGLHAVLLELVLAQFAYGRGHHLLLVLRRKAVKDREEGRALWLVDLLGIVCLHQLLGEAGLHLLALKVWVELVGKELVVLQHVDDLLACEILVLLRGASNRSVIHDSLHRVLIVEEASAVQAFPLMRSSRIV